jgi:hypothetical protein
MQVALGPSVVILSSRGSVGRDSLSSWGKSGGKSGAGGGSGGSGGTA